MGYRLGCPGCGAWTSAVFRAYRDGKKCPYCGSCLNTPENARHYSEQLPGPAPDEAEHRQRLINTTAGSGPAVAGIAGIGRGLPPASGGWMAGVKIPVVMPNGTVEMCAIESDGAVHPPWPAGATGGPYTVWMDNHEGWHPDGPFDTVKECFDAMRAVAHSSDYRITKGVDVEIRENP